MSALPVRPTAVLFDLDGTISESGAVIVATLDETLRSLGHGGLGDVPTRLIVGPPLGESLRDVVGLPAEEIPGVIAAYRALLAPRQSAIPPYDGVLDLIRELAAAGVPLALATSKVLSAAVAVVESYGIAGCFTVLAGSTPDEMRGTKADVVARALAELTERGVDVSGAVMVGDRFHDVVGAGAHGVPTIAVTWGYGAPGEWADAAAVARSVDELRTLLTGR